jgi:hypothetical protein
VEAKKTVHLNQTGGMITIDKEFVETYLKESEDYKCRVKESEKIKVHFSDKPCEIFLKKYQPSEPDWAIEYKTENWRAITKTYAVKVESMIAKIFRASDFVVKFEDGGTAATGETLQDYTEKNFPKTKSLLYYVQAIWLRQYLTEPNGVTLIAPINPVKKGNAYWKPFFTQFDANKVLHFDEEILVIKEGKDKWIVVDQTDIQEVEKIKNGYNVTIIFSHGLGYVPAKYNGGSPKLEDGEFLYESVISGVCPWWDQALVEESDKNVQIKQHMHPEKEVYGDDKCKPCGGSGKTAHTIGIEKRIEHKTCQSCAGSGMATPSASPFGVWHRRPPRGAEAAGPDWSVRYIEKDLKPTEFLDGDIDKRILRGLESVCMAQLAEETADKTESGIKKSYDWEQTNLFLYNIAVDVCQYFLPWCYKTIADYRYGVNGQGWSEEKIQKSLPQINTPQRYDIVGVNDIKAQIAELKEQDISPDIINELEKQLINKEFAGDTDTINYLTSVIELDPLRNYSVEDKSLMTASGFAKTDDAAVSSNIATLIQTLGIDKSFYNLPLEQKKKKLYDLARKEGIIKKEAVLIPINGEGGNLDTPIDVEAEAKAKLKGTVGGVQGVLAIQTSVSQGITDYDAAITLLYEIYGFDDKTARAILGKPKKISLDATQGTQGNTGPSSGTNG